MHKIDILIYLNYELFVTCESSLMSKMTASLHLWYGEKVIELLELVCNDVCGPMSTQAIGGYSYKIQIHILNEV